jgi:cell division cycle 20, cofactor of APC complex
MMSIALGDTVYLYDVKSSSINPLPKHEDLITSVSYSADGRTLAVGTNDACVQLWDVERQTMTRSWQSHNARVNALSWNDSLLTSGSKDQTIMNHDTRIRAPAISMFEGHTQEICGLKWSPNGQQLASGANDNTLKIWELRTTAPRFDLRHHTAAVKAIDWCPWKQDLLASGGGTADRSIRFWNTQTGTCLDNIDTKSQVNSCTFFVRIFVSTLLHKKKKRCRSSLNRQLKISIKV